MLKKRMSQLIKGIRFFRLYLARFPLDSAIKLIKMNSRLQLKLATDNCKLVDIRLKNKREPIYLRSSISDIAVFNQIFMEKQYDIDKIRNCRTIIDCGANIGLSCIYFKMNNPEAVVIAVEPEKCNYELLKRNLREYENLHSIQAGIWSRNCYLEIENLDGPSFGFQVHEVETASNLSIPAITITQIIKDFNIESIDLLKIDIEGSEIELFRQNYEEWLPYVKILVIELHSWYKKGCSEAFYLALSHYKYTESKLGENIVIEFDHSEMNKWL